MTAPASEVRATAELLGRGISEVTSVVRDTHSAIARRVFTVTGRGRPRPTPTRLMHEGISQGVYAAVRLGSSGAAAVAGHAVAAVTELRGLSRGDEPKPLADGRSGGTAIGAINGAWGDWLENTGNPIALSMTLRHGGNDICLTSEGLAHAFPNAAGHLTVWLHGLCETDRSWWLGAARHWGDASSTHGRRLQQLQGSTPVFLRYNSGRHISDNGEDLSHLLRDLVARWPVPVASLSLFGHSMGGLVIRSACADGLINGEPWVPLVRKVVYLGSPHLGAPLEVGAATVRRWLGRLPETAPAGRALASRAAGIKDLRHGSLSLSDWDGIDPDAWRGEPDECMPLLATADHYAIGVTIGRSPDGPVARVIGDALVTWSSAAGRNERRDLQLRSESGRHIGGLHHFDLLNHPLVWDAMRDLLQGNDSSTVAR